MSIENDLKRIADTLEAITEKLGNQPSSASNAPVAATTPVQEKPATTRKRRTKEEMAAAAAEAAAAKVEAKAPNPEPVQAEPAQAEPAQEAAPPFEYDFLKTEVLRLANMGAEGRAATAALMKDFGVAKAIEVPTSRWSELYGRVQTEIAKLEEAEQDDFT